MPQNIPRFAQIISLLWFCLAIGPSIRGAVADELRYDLRPEFAADAVHQVRVALEAKGELRLNAHGGQPRTTSLQVNADLSYRQRVLAAGDGLPRRALRQYSDTTAHIRFADGTVTPTLRASRGWIVAAQDEDRLQLVSPDGPLSRDELDLIHLPADLAAAYRLLPADEVAINDTWTVDGSRLAALAAWDAVRGGEITGTLRKLEGDLALIDVRGELDGAIGGAASRIDLRGKLNFDRGQRRIVWMALWIKETRDIGHAQPGLEMVSRIRLESKPLATASLEHPGGSLAGLNVEDARLLTFHSPFGGFQWLHDRRWQVMTDRPDLAVLRLVDRGELVAQVNVSLLDAGQPLTLEAFQRDVRQSLAEQFDEFIKAETETRADGVRVLRVVAAGQASQVDLHWIFYHLSDAAGRRASVVFTHEARLAETFAAADQQLVSSFQFVAEKAPAENSPAPGETP